MSYLSDKARILIKGYALFDGGMTMRETIVWNGREVGWIDWSPDAYGVQVTVACEQTGDPQALLRCYGQTAGEPLRIGLLEPREGGLHLSRHLSREVLKAHGCAAGAPSAFYLSDGQAAPALHIGDEVLDSLLGQRGVEVEECADAAILRCAFKPDQPFALAPVFVLCTVERDRAALRLKKNPSGQGYCVCGGMD